MESTPLKRMSLRGASRQGPAAATGALLALVAACATAQDAPGRGDDVAITIYSAARPGGIPAELYRPAPGQSVDSGIAVPGYAMVRHERAFRIEAGRSKLRFADVAALIDPTTVTFTSLSDAATRVLEQNFQFDLVSTSKLLQRYVDRQITAERANGGAPISGTLLSASTSEGIVVRGADGSLMAIRDISGLRFPDLPGGLITRPTLEWDLASSRGGEQRTRVTYQTGGLTWWADYNLLFSAGRSANEGTVDLSAWVSLINQSGASYPEAKLKLIAGNVNRVNSAPAPRVMLNMAEARAADGGFSEQTFDEFHLYTLGRRATLPNNSTKQIELFDAARRVPAQRSLVFQGSPMRTFEGGPEPAIDRSYGLAGRPVVETWLTFRNDKASGLGLPLPAGRIRVSRLDAADNSVEFIGEDAIEHTPRDELVRVRLGSAFDVVGDRKQTDFSVDSRARVLDEEFVIELRNHKEEDVEVQVRERLYRGAKANIVSSSLPYRQDSAREASFVVKVPRNGASTLRYRVRYTW